MLIDVEFFLNIFSALTVIHFFAPWAPECTQMNDVLSELAKDNIHVKFLKVMMALF